MDNKLPERFPKAGFLRSLMLWVMGLVVLLTLAKYASQEGAREKIDYSAFMELATNGKIDGKVQIDSTIWSATSDECIDECEKVTVVKVSGVHLFVKKVE